MTRGEIIFEVGLTTGLTRAAGDEELILMQRWVNRGIVDVLLQTRCFLDEGSTTLAAGVTDFRMDGRILAVTDVHVPGGQLEWMNWRDLDELLTLGPAPSMPAFASVNGDFMRVAPAPALDTVVTWFYVPKPTEIVADGTVSDDSKDPSVAAYGGIPTQYHDAILLYVLWKASVYDNKNATRTQGGAPDYEAAYRQRVTEVRKQNRRKGGPGLAAARIGYPNSGRVSTSNDTYP